MTTQSESRADDQITNHLLQLVLQSTRAYLARQRSDDYDMMQSLRHCKRAIGDLSRLTRSADAPSSSAEAIDAIDATTREQVVAMVVSGLSFPQIATSLGLKYKAVRRIARLAGVRGTFERS